MKIDKIIKDLSLEEKVELISGYKNFNIHGIERFNIPPIRLADGPMGIQNNGESTAFPASIGLAATWNKDISYKVGETIGKECVAKNIAVLLAPGVNIYKYHQNGRNFEYMGEDPALAAKMVVPFIKGVQSNNVIATVKHFACNNQDYERHKVSSNVDEQTLNEIYFPPFKAAIQEANVKAVMMSYNPVNNVQASENEYLMRDVLRKQWGFDGIIMSDWVSVYSTKCINAGLDLEMPAGAFMNLENVKNMIGSGEIFESAIDEKVHRILSVCKEMNLHQNKEKTEIDFPKHNAIAYEEAVESLVLLKNQDDILPLDITKDISIAFVGEKCKQIPASGGGAALVKEFCNHSLMDCTEKVPNITSTYFPNTTDADLHNFDYIIAAVGFYKDEEGEAIDRTFALPDKEKNILNSIYKQNKNLITLLIAGGGVEFCNSLEHSQAIIHCWFPGEAGAEAIMDIITGNKNPSGKLPFSWEKNLIDSPVHKNYDKMTNDLPATGEYSIFGKEHENYQLTYSEGIYFGNRYFRSLELQFPFAYGLSYSKFELKNIQTNKQQFHKNETLEISYDVTNISKVSGKEVIRLSIKNLNLQTNRKFKELKDFQKIYIPAQHTVSAKFFLPIKELAYFSNKNWVIDLGTYEIELNNKTTIIEVI